MGECTQNDTTSCLLDEVGQRHMAISVGVGAGYEVRVGLVGFGVRVDVGLCSDFGCGRG